MPLCKPIAEKRTGSTITDLDQSILTSFGWEWKLPFLQLIDAHRVMGTKLQTGFCKKSGYHHGMIFAQLKGHLVMSGDIFGCHT